MITPEQLAKAFGRNAAVIGLQTAGLTHQEALLQTPYNINCLNWTLGHLLVYRGRVLTMAGGQPPFANGELDRYLRESEPVTEDGPGVWQLDKLVGAIAASQESIDTLVGNLTEKDVAVETEIDGRMVGLAKRLFFDYFHDTYHTGQTEILRQVTGTDDKII
ncbi:MAG: hypothetical protein U9N84_09400 [Actinomycetota bacterium]|nr:hypothetical protein [Actinomycetota bacterium]